MGQVVHGDLWCWVTPNLDLRVQQVEVFYGEQGCVDDESNGRKCSLGQGTQSLAGELGSSLNSALILSK